IHVVTRGINMPFIRNVIHEFDANVEFGQPVTRSLRYISASDVLPVLVQALPEPGATAPGGLEGGASPPPTQPVRTTSATATTGGVASTSTTASGSTLNISEELSTQHVDTMPKAVSIVNEQLIDTQRAITSIVYLSLE